MNIEDIKSLVLTELIPNYYKQVAQAQNIQQIKASV